MPVQVSTPSDREVVVERVVNAPRALVFDCHVTPALMKRWLLGPEGWTMPVCEIDLKVGGAYRYGWRGVNGEEMFMSGEYREVLAPERIVQTQFFNDDPASETLVTLELIERDGRTTIRNTMIYPSKEIRDFVLAQDMAYGMEAGYVRLDTLLPELAEA
ncbi:SRPBCC family protein [Caulobacter mirabilis]|uniref:ATPase n=1 Tax=Caulobacter mirabilis TaxID=69666 RepID=A0A2D2B040_9CAUL|nr:SRPBCC family protein [Caulobacter mirabilis]ATQ43629.1 ATPase [Caulobacter mirabilis]